jgi:signal transduction histidine kinase
MSAELKQVEAALAHDLNNILQVIMGNLELLKRRGELVPEVVDAALQATRSAASLADRMGAIGRLRRYEARTMDVNRLLADLAPLLERTVGDAIRAEMKLASAMPNIVADPHALQLALVELATNSRFAMPAGGRFSVSTSRADDDFVRIDVADTGSGMPPTTAEPTGLGLQIVRQCMALANGRAEFKSNHMGTTVKLFLPVAK